MLAQIDRRIIEATQKGLPLSSRPYGEIAARLGLDEQEVIQRMRDMLECGIIRRMGVIPNHYALGWSANGMSVWDVPGDEVCTLGKMVGELDFVSHCYHRPRHPPIWSYNLFAMVHGSSRDEVEDKVGFIAKKLGCHDRGHEILYSTRILKKTGLRLTS